MKGFIVLILSVVFLAGCQSTKSQRNIAPQDNAKKTASDPQSTQNISLDEYCLDNPCRKNKHVNFRTANGDFDQVLEVYWPAAQGDRISILPGDELFIEADEVDGKLINFRQVDAIVNQNVTLTFSLSQMSTGLGMMLSVSNPFAKNIKYHLNIIDFSGRPHQTSSCPVRAGLSVFESWGHPIPELILSDMHFVEQDAASCIY